MSKKIVWLHPFLFAIYPALALYGLNTSQLLLSALIAPLSVYLAIGIGMYALAYLYFRDFDKSALMVSSVFGVSVAFGHGFEWLDTTVVGKYLLDEYTWIWGVFTLWLLFTIFRMIRAMRSTREFTRAATVVAVVLILFPFVQVARYYQADIRTSVHVEAPVVPHEAPVPGRPDIYYIILDGYTRQDVLADIYGYDNSPFIDGLRKLGFVVLPKARTNYCYTHLSLASSLNMDYLTGLNHAPNQEMTALAMIRTNQVMTSMKSSGYQVIHFDSGWVVTGGKLPQADVNLTSRNLSQYAITLEQTSLLRFFVKHPFFVESQRQVLSYNFSKIKDIPKIPGPKFVFLHLVCPHPPFVFDRHGRLPIRDKSTAPLESMWLPKERYVDQLDYLNGKVLEAVTKILEISPTPPVIILQGDHGSATSDLGSEPAPETVYLRTSILNAFYLPGRGRDLLPSTITPVNTFRFILNTYLGEQWPYLENKTYFSGPIGASPYTFIDVTHFPGYKSEIRSPTEKRTPGLTTGGSGVD